MKTSTEIRSISNHVGEERAVELVAKAGFDAWDFAMQNMVGFDKKKGGIILTGHPLSERGYLRFARKLKQIGIDNGIHCNQTHAPYPCESDDMIPYLLRAIECTAEVGGEICVIHPKNHRSAKENAEMYLKLLPFAKECGVKIATENMWKWNKETDKADFAACCTAEDFNAHLDAVDDDYFVACLDLGHAEMMGNLSSAVDMIKKLNHRLKALHIHDNNKWHDSHQIPFSMDIDFKAIIEALKSVGYEGYFTLESYLYLKNFDTENLFQGVKNLAESARRLADMYEAKGI